jgi:polyisoprenoid-binding protein YceI
MTSISLRLALTIAALLIAAASARADTWVFDKQHTEVRFSWDHLGLSRRSGRFLDMDGALNFTPTEPDAGTVELSIRTASVSTGTKELDDALKSTDFFAAGAHPKITFRSTGIVKRGERTGDILGELTIMGVTRPVKLAATWNFTGEHPLASSNTTFQGKWVSGFTATATVLRSEFGLKRGIPLLSDEVRIDIDAVFFRKE